MSGTIQSRLAEPVRREIELAAAVARERLLDMHFVQVMEFLQRARGEVTPPRVLEIYGRLHHLSAVDARVLTHRVFVALGKQLVEGTPEDASLAGDGGHDWNGPATLFGRIRKRLRGRMNTELRRWVELHTGRAEVALLQVHVENALHFVRILNPEGSYAGPVDLYTEIMAVPPSRSEVLYFLTLDRLSRSGPDTPGTKQPPHPQIAPTTRRALRVIDSRG